MERNRLSIEVDQDDHAFVESICTQSGYTFYTLFKHFLALYKKSLTEPMHAVEVKAAQPQSEQIEEKTFDEKKSKPKKFREK